MPLEARIDCVTIDYPDRGFAVAMSEVVRFHVEGPADGGPLLLNLDPLLGASVPPGPRAACVLVVRPPGGGDVGFRTRGVVRLQRARERALFRLPRVLREAGCPTWVHGVVAEDRESGAVESLRIWISLLHLARSMERGASAATSERGDAATNGVRS